MAIFIDSEIWPSMYRTLKKIYTFNFNERKNNRKIFRRWKFFSKFTGNILKSIKIAYPSNTDTHNYLKELKVEKIKKDRKFKVYLFKKK